MPIFAPGSTRSRHANGTDELLLTITMQMRQCRRKTVRLAAHLALQPGQLLIDIPSVMPGQRTAVGVLADLAVGPIPRNLLTVERHLDGEDDGCDDEKGCPYSVKTGEAGPEALPTSSLPNLVRVFIW